MSTLTVRATRLRGARFRAAVVAVALAAACLPGAADPAPVAAGTDGSTYLKFIQPWDLPAQLPATAGQVFFLKVTGYAPDGWRRFFTDAVHFTSTDPAATLPADYGFSCVIPYTSFACDDDGGHIFPFIFRTPGTHTLTVTDIGTPSITGSTTFDVRPGAASSMTLTGLPASTVKGATSNVKVTLRDANGNVATGYTGTVHVSTTDGAATLPPDFSFSPADAGVAYLPVAFNSTGSQSVTVVDTGNALLHATAGTTVAAAPHIVLDLGDTNAWAGSMIWGVLSVATAGGVTDPSYRGTVRFTSSDPAASLPDDLTFTAQLAGHDSSVLQDVVFHTAGTQTLTVTDVANPSITGSITVNVRGGSVATIQLRWLPDGTTAGTMMRAAVFGFDAWGNPAQATWKAHLLSSDPQAVLPADYTLHVADGGQHAFDVALRTAGTRTIGAEVVSHTGINATRTIAVQPAAVSALSVTGMTNPVQAGTAGAVTVRSIDAFGNAVPAYFGTVHFTSSDPAAILPADAAFTGGDNGARGFVVTLKTAGTRSITATDTSTASITGSQAGITVYTVDATAPTVSVPSIALRTGVSLSGTAAPITVSWTGSDDAAGSGIDHFALERSTDGGGTWTTVVTTSAVKANTTLPVGGTVRFRVSAWDHAGNRRTGSASATMTPRLIQQTSLASRTGGAWSTASSSSYSGGSVLYAKRAGVSASFTFTAKRIALVMAEGPTRGKVKVYVNGAYQTTLSLYATSSAYRVVTWQKAWSTSATRTVKLVVVGTSGHPRVDIDAFVTVK